MRTIRCVTSLAVLLGSLLAAQSASVIQFTSRIVSASEDSTTAEIIVRRTNDLDTVVSVEFATTNLTATPGVDYLEIATNLTFLAGETNLIVAIPILNDGEVEGAEKFQAVLSNPGGGATLGSFARITVTIVDNDVGLQVGYPTYRVREVESFVVIPVVRGDDGDFSVSVDFSTADGTALAGEDYVATQGTVEIAAHGEPALLQIPILNDGEKEPTETFDVSLSNPTGITLGGVASATVYISDNDQGPQFEYLRYSVQEDEPFVLIAVLRGNDGDFQVTVDFSTVGGSAVAGQDFVSTHGSIVFASVEEQVKFIQVPILNDGVKEADETFQLMLANPGNGVLGTVTNASVTITDNDPGVQFEQALRWIRETEGLLTLKALRGNDVDLPAFSVEYASSNLTAVAGEDYVETNGTLNFAEGETLKELTVPVLRNDTSEADKQFLITLQNPSAGMVLGPNAMVKITVLDMTGMEVHRFDEVVVLPDQSVRLTLGGGVHQRFREYFDLYPIEVSSNLTDWTPLTTLVRSNASSDALVLTDWAPSARETRFYRTPSTHFIAPHMKPTGPFPVGVVSRIITDPNLRNRYHLSTNGSFAVSIWYPAVARSGVLPSPLEDPRLASDPNWPSWYWYGNVGLRCKDREPYFVSHALPDVECAPTAAPFPVVVYSPGGWGGRTETAGRGPELASHGYVVVTGDPEDVYASAFPDGRYLYGDGASVLTEAGFESRLRDLRLILDELDRWNQSDPVLAGRLQVTNAASLGYSWGVDATVELCRVDPRCRATIVLDGSVQDWHEVLRRGLAKPCLSLHRADNTDVRLYNLSAADSVWFQFRNANHDVFGDTYWALGGQALGLATARVIDIYAVWFLNKQLKGIDQPVPAPDHFPEVFNFRQK
jgi:dienelactone hydrolase